MDLDWFRTATEWNDYCNRRTYDAPADPWTPVWVDPSTVEYYAVVSLRWGLGRVRGGEWDRPENRDRVADTYIYEGLTDRFERGLDWEDTAYVRWAAEQFEERDVVRSCEDLEEFVEGRCAALDDLYEGIRRDGYSPNYERLYDGPEDVEYVHDLEPLVLIGRSGEVVWSEGFHRLVLADLAGVDAIPVYVLRRHERWQRIRDAVATTGSLPPDCEEDVDHPDLRDLVA